MEIVSRAVAKHLRLSKYFTGKICVNGHVAERYTESGACSECINGSKKSLTAEETQIKDAEKARLEAVKESLGFFVDIKITVAMKDVATVQAMALAFAYPRCGPIAISYLWISGPTHGVLYKVRCHPDDVTLFRELTNKLFNQSQRIDQTAIAAKFAQFDPPPLPPVTIDDIAK
jgi:hypothetical protein